MVIVQLVVFPLQYRLTDGEEGLDQILQQVKTEHIGTVRFGLRRIWMCLEEEAICSYSDGGFGYSGYHIGTASGDP